MIGAMSGRSFLLFLWCITATAMPAATFSVTIKAVDRESRPVPQADVMLFWTIRDAATLKNRAQAVTDADGKALLDIDDWNEKRPVLVLSADRRLAGIAGASKADDGKELTVALVPTIRIRGKLVCSELNSKPSWANTMITADGFRAPIAQSMANSTDFEF